ncbi:MAG: hypothetical protein WBA84_10275 [Carnobacterium sp.]|uniref:hypothetical protein n=1 Tax=Carnobacterium sp. TaxID=48221 RepID=UPI003C786672
MKNLDELLLLLYLLILTIMFGYYVFLQKDYALLIFFIVSLVVFLRRISLFIKQNKENKVPR